MALIVIEGRDAPERNAGKEGLHVLDRVDGDADPAHFAGGERVIGVVADLGRQIEGHREPRLAAFEQPAIAPVRGGGGGVAGVLPHGPEPFPVSGGADPPGVNGGSPGSPIRSSPPAASSGR